MNRTFQLVLAIGAMLIASATAFADVRLQGAGATRPAPIYRDRHIENNQASITEDRRRNRGSLAE